MFEMKKRIANQILEEAGILSVLIDESTSLGRKSTLIVYYFKCEVTKKDSAFFLFLDLVKLSDQTSKTVAETLLDCLRKNRFGESYLENLMAFASDGLSVTLGNKSGVAKILLKSILIS